MADEKVVQAPTLDPPPASKPDEKPAGEINYAELIGRLEKAGITKPEQLDGKLTAAQERGHLANILGQRNQELAEMKAMLSEMKASQKKASHSSYDDEPNAGAIDIGDLIGKKVKEVIQGEKREALEAQQRAWHAWQQIQTDRDYHLVKDEWEAKMRDPNFAISLQAGTINPIDEYREMLRDHYKSGLRLAAETIKSLTTGGMPQKVHVEDSARIPGGKEIPSDDKRKLIDSARDKVNKGKQLSEEEQLAALEAVLMGGARK
jgi:hypothetical protein